eukprot:TRINITY_DN508_c1_g1_i2.p1 TRINITY_DN508_c1_g1~~TRINITY_DN508_c1_g1_i2.p1  ORF type:complete len:633 (-),score=176.01 TRINITY_DN508_c1_g1_i2:56-1954(-)
MQLFPGVLSVLGCKCLLKLGHIPEDTPVVLDFLKHTYLFAKESGDEGVLVKRLLDAGISNALIHVVLAVAEERATLPPVLDLCALTSAKEVEAALCEHFRFKDAAALSEHFLRCGVAKHGDVPSVIWRDWTAMQELGVTQEMLAQRIEAMFALGKYNKNVRLYYDLEGPDDDRSKQRAEYERIREMFRSMGEGNLLIYNRTTHILEHAYYHVYYFELLGRRVDPLHVVDTSAAFPSQVPGTGFCVVSARDGAHKALEGDAVTRGSVLATAPPVAVRRVGRDEPCCARARAGSAGRYGAMATKKALPEAAAAAEKCAGVQHTSRQLSVSEVERRAREHMCVVVTDARVDDTRLHCAVLASTGTVYVEAAEEAVDGVRSLAAFLSRLLVGCCLRKRRHGAAAAVVPVTVACYGQVVPHLEDLAACLDAVRAHALEAGFEWVAAVDVCEASYAPPIAPFLSHAQAHGLRLEGNTTIELPFGFRWYTSHYARVVLLLLAFEKDAAGTASVIRDMEPLYQPGHAPVIDQEVMDETVFLLMRRVLGVPNYMEGEGLAALLFALAPSFSEPAAQWRHEDVVRREALAHERVAHGCSVLCSDLLPYMIRSAALFEADVRTRVDPAAWCHLLRLNRNTPQH